MKKVQTEKVVVLGCVHTPLQDQKAVDAALDFIKYWKPNTVYVNGDAYDLFPVSKYFKVASRVGQMKEEINEARKFNRDLRKAAGTDADIILQQGNHEARWEVYLNNGIPQLADLEDFSFESVFHLGDENIQYKRGLNGNYARSMVGGVLVGHFPIIRADSGSTAKSLVNRYFGSVIAHHSHRMGTFEKQTPNGRFIGQEGGCLCTLEPEYTEAPNWSQGFVTMERILDKDTFHISPIRIINGRILYEGKVFE